MANPFVHVELHTNDLARARQFYTSLFGWKLQDVPAVLMDVTEVGQFGWMSVIIDPAGATLAMWRPKSSE